MADNDDQVDLAAPGADEPPQTTQTPPPPPPASPTNPDADQMAHERDSFKRIRHDAIERRYTRLGMYGVVLLFAILFLGFGLHFALKVGNGLLEAKQEIVTALTGKKEECVVPIKCITEAARTTPTAASTPAHDPSIIANLNTDWLSASSLIAIVAFILGVGLTLILTLLKSTYQHPTDKDLNKKEDSSNIELATPLSQLIERAIGYLKEKFSK